MMILLPLWPFLGVVGLAAAAGCAFGLVCAWHPGRPRPAVSEPGPAFTGALRSRHDWPDPSGGEAEPSHPAPLPAAGYFDLPNTGCYEPRTGWPEPDWPDGTFSEISAGFARLERNVIAETQPFSKIRP